jgi:hypothetical protein
LNMSLSKRSGPLSFTGEQRPLVDRTAATSYPWLKLPTFYELAAPLLADVHGFLDNEKAPIELVEKRAQFDSSYLAYSKL